MSIFAGFGAAPSSFTAPLIDPTVAGSMGVATGAAGAEAGAEVDCSVFSFLLHAASNQRPTRASRGRIANLEFVMMCTFLLVLNRTAKTNYFNANLRRLCPRSALRGASR